MNLFNFFKTGADHTAASQIDSSQREEAFETKPSLMNEPPGEPGAKVALPEIPENVFIEYATAKPKDKMEPSETKQEVNDLQSLYRYLEQNLEKKGYEDALVNPDTSYMDEHVQYIGNELGLLIAKIKTYYSGYMRTIDFHIETRKRSGMIETVDELLSHKETVLEEIKIVAVIETDAGKGIGLSQNLILGYKKGFRNGFAAITYNSVLGRKN